MSLVTDNFNRANGSVGANWTQPPASQGTLNVIGNQCGVSLNNIFCAGFWNADTFPNDQYSQATVAVGSTTGSEAIGLIVRAKAGVDEFYLGFITDTQYQIYKRQSGAYTLLVAQFPFSTAPGDVIKLEATGTNPVNVILYQNGIIRAAVAAATTSIINGGSPGILILDTGHSLRWDDWQSESTSVIVNLTGVAATPAIGSGIVEIETPTAPVEPPVSAGGGGMVRRLVDSKVRVTRRIKRVPRVLPATRVRRRGVKAKAVVGRMSFNTSYHLTGLPDPVSCVNTGTVGIGFELYEDEIIALLSTIK